MRGSKLAMKGVMKGIMCRYIVFTTSLGFCPTGLPTATQELRARVQPRRELAAHRAAQGGVRDAAQDDRSHGQESALVRKKILHEINK